MPCWYQWLQGGAYTMTTTRNPRVVFKGLLVVGGIIFCYTFHSWNVLKCLISRIPTKTIYTFLFNFLFCVTQHVTEWRQQVKLLCLHFGVFQYLSILYFFHLFLVCLETLLSPDLQVLSLSFFYPLPLKGEAVTSVSVTTNTLFHHKVQHTHTLRSSCCFYLMPNSNLPYESPDRSTQSRLNTCTQTFNHGPAARATYKSIL